MQNVDTALGTVDFYLLGIDNRLIHTDKQVTSVSPQAVTESQLFVHTGGEPHEYTSLLTDNPAVGISQKLVIPQFVLVAELPSTQVTTATDLSRFAWPMLAISVIGLLMMLVVGFVLELTVARPVQTILNMAVGLVQGRPATAANVFNRSDELIQLQDSLIQLGEQIQQDNVSLEKRINARIQSMNSARSVTRALLTVRSVNSLYSEIATLIQQHFNAIENVQFFGVDPNNTAAIILHTTDKIYGRTRSANQWPITIQNLIGRVVISKSASILLETDATDTGDTLMPNMRAELGIPLTDNNEVVGILDLQSSGLTAFSQAEISIFTDIAEMIVTALKNVRQFEQLQTKLTETEAMNEQLVGETWRKYVTTRPATPITGNKNANEAWSDTQRRALQSNALAENVGPDTVTFAVPVSLRNQVLGAVEWEVPRTAYNESTRQLAHELATRLAISADNARLFEQSQWTAQRERLVNEISSKLTQQTDVAEILKIAVREVGQALRLPQTSIRLATNEETQ
jgi:GAF domain-containing protein